MTPGWLSARRFRTWLRSGGRLTFKTASITLFVVLVGMLAFFTAASSSIIAATLGMFILFYALKGVLPANAIDEITSDMMTGELGERYWERFTRFLTALRRRLPF